MMMECPIVNRAVARRKVVSVWIVISVKHTAAVPNVSKTTVNRSRAVGVVTNAVNIAPAVTRIKSMKVKSVWINQRPVRRPPRPHQQQRAPLS